MRIVDIKECAVHISRYPPFCAAPSTLTTSLVAVITDVQTPTGMLTGYGFSSFGRFAQSGLIRERFAPRLLGAADDLNDETGTNFDPFRAWDVMMKSEKPGGHGERCVAVGTLDMAIWDAAAKVAGLPLYRFLASRIPMAQPLPGDVPVYGAGGYQYPEDDIRHLSDEVRALRDLGCSRFKIKIGRSPLDQDVRRIEAVLELVSPDRLAVDAMHAYDLERSLEVADRLEPYGFWWIEDFVDPLDFEGLATITTSYRGRIAAGEALFSKAEAKLLHKYGGLSSDRDVLLFDPVHCYGVPGYLQIFEFLLERGWPRSAFWPHGGHLFSIHISKALGLGGAEVNPLCFQPLGGLYEDAKIVGGSAPLPEAPGIGFEQKPELWQLLRGL